MLPLTLITGFLGSGKTTLLRRLLERHRHRRIVYLVNEFGAVDVDGHTLPLPPGELVSIPGGSIFCKCLVGEFIRVLRDIGGAEGDAPEGVVIEASGIAEPRVVGQMLEETRLAERYALKCIATVIDPGSFLKLLHTLPSIIAQVEAADVAIINKVDLYGAQQVQQTEDALLQIQPGLDVVRAQRCRIERDLLAFEGAGGPVRRSLDGTYAAGTDPDYVSTHVTFEQPVDLSALLAALRALPSEVYRVKGFVPTVDGTMYIDRSAGGTVCEPVQGAGQPGPEHELVFIFAPACREMIQAMLRTLRPGYMAIL